MMSDGDRVFMSDVTEQNAEVSAGGTNVESVAAGEAGKVIDAKGVDAGVIHAHVIDAEVVDAGAGSAGEVDPRTDAEVVERHQPEQPKVEEPKDAECCCGCGCKGVNESSTKECQSVSGSPASGSSVSASGQTPDGEDASDDAAGVELDDNVVTVDPMDVLRQEHRKVREQLVRLAADFDNFRKRSARDVQEAIKRSKSEIISDLLPVFDNMERAVAHAETSVGMVDARAVVAGVSMVNRQFLDCIGKLGVERVKSVGTVFDPTIHEAIHLQETADAEPGTVTTEVLGGYRWGGRLIRAAMVVVAKAPAISPEAVDGVSVSDAADADDGVDGVDDAEAGQCVDGIEPEACVDDGSSGSGGVVGGVSADGLEAVVDEK
ncbi:MAG: nucleotide exchange factor GrpE [Polyangiaceae bacterium]|nr:nucleotide exchange factor GrpE [Polyangiaceae bacterium]